MNNSKCGCDFNCTLFSVITSIVIGIIVAYLSATAAITITSAFGWTILIIALLYLTLIFVNAYLRRNSYGFCITRALPTLLTGILGSIVTSAIFLGAAFPATSTAGAIVAGLASFFFTLIILSAVCLVFCISEMSAND